MKEKDDKFYLIHISECIERIVHYTSGGEEVFFKDTKTQDAVVRNLQVLAESTIHLSENLKVRFPDIDWKAIRGFRNILVHDYLGVRLDRVWNIVEQHVPGLKVRVAAAIKDLETTQQSSGEVDAPKPD